jgi:hypothetical protein
MSNNVPRFTIESLSGNRYAPDPDMENLKLNRPQFGFIVATRAALAFGVGLLVADRIPKERRRAIGAALVSLGAATTIPALMLVFGNRTRALDA